MTREEAIAILKTFMGNPLFSDAHKAAFNIAIHDIKQRHDWDLNNLMLINKETQEPAEQEPKSEWEHDHEILKAYADGANNALDKIRAEIEQIHLIGYATVNGKREIASSAVMQILDKYKAESEEV